MKKAVFLGNSLQVIRDLPRDAQHEVGYQLDRVQLGREPKNWKPLKTVGPSVREIRVHVVSGAFRAVYVATFADAIYVLHVFQKKTEATPKRDIDIARRRYIELRRSMQ